MISVTCNGCFDGLHYGHIFLLGCVWAVAELAEGEVVVGINSDSYIRRKKGHEPVPAAERVAAVMATGLVGRVVVFEEDDPREFIKSIRPVAHLVGNEYEGTAIEAFLVSEIGARMIYVPRVGDWASSKLRKAHAGND